MLCTEPRPSSAPRTFLGKAPPFAQARSAVQHFAFGAGGGGVSVLAQRVAPARVPGRVLAQASLGLGLEPGLVHRPHRSGNPVPVDLVVGFGARAVRVAQVTQVVRFCTEKDGLNKRSAHKFNNISLIKHTRPGS